MKKFKVGAAAVAMASVSLPLGLGAATAGAANVPKNPAVSTQDVRWMQGNARTDLAEIAIGKLALKRARLSDTKMMAEVTISDHTKALAKVEALAKELDVTMPDSVNVVQKAAGAELKAIADGRFDRAYDTIQIAGHVTSITKTKSEIAVGKDAAVIAFAKYYLPVAQKHLTMAKANLAALPNG
jgi:putative membrane protein